MHTAQRGDLEDDPRGLEELITINGGLWIGDRTWLDLSHVREVRTVVVLLEDVGPVATALNLLRRAGVLQTRQLPWITSLHDLKVIAEILEHPAEFLLYLRRRTDSEVAVLFDAVDELDLFMLFVKGHLYAAEDPRIMHALHPAMPAPSPAEVRRYEAGRVPTRVGTQTDDLDTWMQQEPGAAPPPKPRFTSEVAVVRLVAALHRERAEGWFRFASDLLNLDSSSQRKVGRLIKAATERSRLDGRYHDFMESLAGRWGYPTLFVGVCPRGMRMKEALARLGRYTRAKRHQLASDRSLAILVDESGTVIASGYFNEPPRADEELDALGAELGLRPVTVTGAGPVPPSALRRTRRLRGRRRKP